MKLQGESRASLSLAKEEESREVRPLFSRSAKLSAMGMCV